MISQRSEAIDRLFSKVDRDENLPLENAVELLNIETALLIFTGCWQKLRN